MFIVNDDLSIYATRGDIVCLNVSATDDRTGEPYEFQPGDILQMKIFVKKNAEEVVLQKDIPVPAKTNTVGVFLTEQDTRIGEVISKPVDYWYEVTLNPYTNPQTFIGYDEDGAKIFKLFPEGNEVDEDEPTKPEDIPVVDADLSLLSSRPVENRAIARAITLVQNDMTMMDERLTGKIKENKRNHEALAEQVAESTADMEQEIAVERARIDNLIVDPAAGDAELTDIRVGADGVTYDSAGTAVRAQISDMSDNIVYETALLTESELTVEPLLYDGFAKYQTGIVSNDSFDGYYKRTGFVYIPSLCAKITHNFVANDEGVDGIAFYDKAKQYITGYKSDGEITDIPDGARYVVFSNYDFLREHSGKTFTLIAKPKDTEADIQTLVTFGDSHVARGLWQQKVIDQFAVKNHINLGIGGSTVAVNEAATVLPFVDDTRIAAIKDANPDTIIIIGGTNDVHLHTPLGTMSDISSGDKTTFYGACGYLIETLLTWKPELRIVLCTTPQGFYDNIHPVKYSEISDAVREIALNYSLPVADIFGECGINKINLSTYSDDLIHYNELGNERVSAVVVNTIKRSYFG